MVKMLVELGADVNAINDYLGSTPLSSAAANDSPRVAEYLLLMKADVNATDKFGRTALDFAEYHKNQRVVSILHKHDAIRGSADFGKH